jgi:flavin reductase (DIM6/NTAB) family NADH-FMN oxidoreductase RutF
LDEIQLRRALGRFATGVAVVTTCGDDGKLEGVTSNSFSSVSLDPPLVLWSLARRAASFEAFARATCFAVNVLGAEQVHLSRHFATPHADKFLGIASHAGRGGCPMIDGAIAQFECRTQTIVDGGDHAIILGLVMSATLSDGEPLIFADSSYHQPVGLAGRNG